MSSQPAYQPAEKPVSEPETKPRVTVEEYLAQERLSEMRHEYVDGEIIAMAGESLLHNRIAGNIYRTLESAFGDRPCSAFFENIRVRVSPTQYRYPDIVALCKEPVTDNDNPPALLNPSVIIEVMSPSTERFDRDGKFWEYRQIPDVTDYVLVAQAQILVIHYARQSLTQWTLNEYSSLSDTLYFASVDASLPLADIYRKTQG